MRLSDPFPGELLLYETTGDDMGGIALVVFPIAVVAAVKVEVVLVGRGEIVTGLTEGDWVILMRPIPSSRSSSSLKGWLVRLCCRAERAALDNPCRTLLNK